MSDELASVDGALMPIAEATIPATDEGLLRGDGVFEVARVYDGVPFAMGEHFERMERSAANLRIEHLPRTELEREVADLIEARGGSAFDGCVRFFVTRGGRRIVMTEPLKNGPEHLRLATVTYAPTRVMDGVKSLSYGANMLCTRIAKERGFDEALLVTPHGRVLEAPTSSFFWVDSRGKLCTPPLEDHILASITRAHLLELVEVEERSIGYDELIVDAREAFIASTTREVHPVKLIDDTELNAPGEVSAKAQAAFTAYLDQALGRR